MSKMENGMICLLRSAITGEAYQLPEGFALDDIIEDCFNHSVVALIYMGALNCGFKKDELAMQLMFKQYMKEMFVSEHQMSEVAKIYEAFEAKKIDFMPVKGCNMKGLYPSPEMRNMGDADILIREEQYSVIEEIMKDLGYVFDAKGDHDYAWSSQGLHVELHYKLMYYYTKEYEEYFGTGWKLATENEGHRYYMKNEDEFIYLFIHFTKHFRNGGVGCRHVMDLWIYLRNHMNMDMKYIDNTMKKLSVHEFYINVMAMIEYWFNEGPKTEKLEFMTDYIMVSGNWGTYENNIKSSGVREAQLAGSTGKGRFQSIRKALFPDLENLQLRYGILKKIPVLLPVMWVWRWIDAALHRRNNVKSLTRQVSQVCTTDFSDFEESLEYVGLDFTFKENN